MDNMLEDMLHRESIEMSEPSHHVPHVHSLSGRSALVCTFIDVHPACSFLLLSHSCISLWFYKCTSRRRVRRHTCHNPTLGQKLHVMKQSRSSMCRLLRLMVRLMMTSLEFLSPSTTRILFPESTSTRVGASLGMQALCIGRESSA